MLVDPGQGANVTVSPGATSSTADDVYTVNYSVPLSGLFYAQSFSGLANSSDALGSFRRANGAGGDEFYLYDFGNALGGSLDYVQLGRFVRRQGTDTSYGYFAYGRETLASAMPASGTVTFLGRSHGHGSNGSALFESASTVRMTVNFAMGAITGELTGFQTQNSQVGNPEALDLQFSGTILPGTPRFQGTAQSAFPPSSGGVGFNGSITGAFLGADGAAPDEVGFAYTLDNSLAQIFGVSALQRQN